MALHYVRDVNLPGGSPSSLYNTGHNAMGLVDFHMLRLGGAEWLWECDGEVGPYATDPNHVVDGNMDAPTAGDWTAIGSTPAVLSKDTTEKFSGSQSLKVVSKAVGSGVQSSTLLSMTNPTNQTHAATHNLTGPVKGVMKLANNTVNYAVERIGCRIIVAGCTNAGNNGTFNITSVVPNNDLYFYNPSGVAEILSASVTTIVQRKYEIAIWAKAEVGVSWDVKVDPGTGSYTTVGTLVGDGTWKRYPYSFYRTGTGVSNIQVVDPTHAADRTIYINGINVFRSMYEYQVGNVYGSDGSVTGTTTFDTGSYTPSADDVGKFLLYWDDDYPDNTGCYEITGISGGDYQLDLRSGSMTLTTHLSGDIPWRIIDLQSWRFDNGSPGDAYGGAGYGIESPHSSKWRYFARETNATGAEYNNHIALIWASPEDTDFDLSSGVFYNTGPSTQRERTGAYSRAGGGYQQHYWGGPSSPSGGNTFSTKLYFVTDDDLSFFSHYLWYVTNRNDSWIFIGYTGTDADHPGIEEFAVLAPRHTSPVSGQQEVGFDGGVYRSLYDGTTFSPEGRGVRCIASSLGYSTATAAVITQSNASLNPWSSEEHIDPILLVRDPMLDEGCPSERELTKGFFMGRINLPNRATFDTAAYLHFTAGLVLENNGATVV